MENVECLGDEFYCNESRHGNNEMITVFPALKRFTLEEMPKLEEWAAMAASVMFPCLEDLDIFDCPFLKSVPLTGQCSSLEKLNLKQCSNLSSIGDGLATSKHLKKLSIAECSNLCSIPNLDGFSTLASLDVSDCDELEIVPITGRRSSLEILQISWCWKPSKIGDGLSTSTCLQELSLEGCPDLSFIPDLARFSSLRIIDVSGCDKLENVPIIGRCSSLQKLRISECPILSKIGDGVSAAACLKELSLSYCPNLISFPSLEGLSCLQSLKVFCCYKLERVPITRPLPSLEFVHIGGCETKSNLEDVLPTSTCLISLKIDDCKYLTSVSRLDGFSSLGELMISQCPQLRSVPIMGEFSSLRKLIIHECKELICIGDGLSTSRRLEEMSIEFCPNLRSIPDIDEVSSLAKLIFIQAGKGSTCVLPKLLGSTTCLSLVRISGLSDLISIPESLGKLRSLDELTIVECPRLKSIPDVSFGSLTNLEALKLGGFSQEPEEFPGLNSIQHLSATLQSLYLIGWEKLKSLPHPVQHLAGLRILTLERFQGIEALPEWLGNLSFLEQLKIISRDNFMYLPSLNVLQSLSKLKTFRIVCCTQLETR